MSIAREKITEAWNRDAAAHPTADWTFSTSETRRLEDELNASIDRFERGECGLDEVRAAYREWIGAKLAKGQPRALFEL